MWRCTPDPCTCVCLPVCVVCQLRRAVPSQGWTVVVEWAVEGTEPNTHPIIRKSELNKSLGAFIQLYDAVSLVPKWRGLSRLDFTVPSISDASDASVSKYCGLFACLWHQLHLAMACGAEI